MEMVLCIATMLLVGLGYLSIQVDLTRVLADMVNPVVLVEKRNYIDDEVTQEYSEVTNDVKLKETDNFAVVDVMAILHTNTVFKDNVMVFLRFKIDMVPVACQRFILRQFFISELVKRHICGVDYKIEIKDFAIHDNVSEYLEDPEELEYKNSQVFQNYRSYS